MVTAHVFIPIRLKKVHSDRIVSITCHSKDRRTGIDDMDSENERKNCKHDSIYYIYLTPAKRR